VRPGEGLRDENYLAAQEGERRREDEDCILKLTIEDQGVRVNILPASVSCHVSFWRAVF
jgi:hypothetical protein